MTKTAVLPPPLAPRSTNRLSLTFSTSTTFAASAAGCAFTMARLLPITTTAPNTNARFMATGYSDQTRISMGNRCPIGV